MLPNSPNQPLDSQTMRQILLMMMLRDMQGQQQQQKPPGLNLSRMLETLGGGSAGGAAASGAAGAGAGAVTLGSGGVATIPAGASVPAGYTAVGTSVTGGTMVAPTASAGAGAAAGSGASASGAAAGGLPGVDPITLAIAAVVGGLYTMNRQGQKTKTLTGGDALKKSFKDPWSWVFPAPAVVGALWGDKDMYLKEHRKLLGLQKQGINVPENLLNATRLEKGRSKEQLIAEEQAKLDRGEYGNVKFAESRNEADLKPQDIVGYAAFMDKFGNDWFGKFSDSQRKAIGQKALDAKAVRERHGTINVDWDKVGLPEDLSTLSYNEAPATTSQTVIPKVGRGQVGRVSPGMYVNDQGQVTRATTSQQAMQQNYGNNKIPKKRR